MLIRFGCSIWMPTQGRFNRGKFLFHEEFKHDPERFLHGWLSGAVGTIYTGPIINRRADHDGRLLTVPMVKVKYLPNDS